LRAIYRFKLRGTRSDRGRRAESSVGPAPVHLVGREADSVTWSGPRESGGSATRVTWAGAPRRPRRATRRKRTGEWARTRQQPPSPIIDILAAGSLIRSRPPSFTLRCVPLPTQLFFSGAVSFFSESCLVLRHGGMKSGSRPSGSDSCPRFAEERVVSFGTTRAHRQQPM
jgi:hypothetical protein